MQMLTQYELIRELGRGGSAVTHLVRSQETGELFARKVLSNSQRSRFERELSILSTLDHPQIAKIRFANIAEDPPSIFMDFVDGETLEALRQRLPFVLPELSVAIIKELLTALEYAHTKGVIHRDLKPANVLIDHHGNVILVDFGLAITSELTRMTEHSGLVGSFDYLAPEQISNDTLDAGCDVFSTSVILYYLVTGTLPFSRHSVASTLNAIQNDSIEEAFRRNPKVSRELGSLISRGLQKKREDRFSSAVEYRQALSNYLDSVGFYSNGWSLKQWIDSPSATVMNRLEACSAHLVEVANRFSHTSKKPQFIEALNHLSLKSPQNPAIDRLMKKYETENSKRRRTKSYGAFAALIGILTGWVTYSKLQTQPIKTEKTSLQKAQADNSLLPSTDLKPLEVMKTAEKNEIMKSPKHFKSSARKIKGRVQFKVPEGTRVFWDGRLVNPAKELIEDIGNHTLLMELEGMDPIRADVKVAENEPTVIQVGEP